MDRGGSRRVTLIRYFKVIAAAFIGFFFTCSFLFTVRISSSTNSNDHRVLKFDPYRIIPTRRNALSLASDNLNVRLDESREAVNDHHKLVLTYAAFARKLKLEYSKLVRNFAELSLNFTDLMKKPYYQDLWNPSGMHVSNPNKTMVLRQFEKEAKEHIKNARQVISKAKDSFDCQLKVQKLKDTTFALNDHLAKIKKDSEAFRLTAAKAIPRDLHCLSLRLMQERIENPNEYINRQVIPPPEFEDPNLYHYAIFSDNVLAVSVVVNSVVQNAKEPGKHVLHIVTDKTILTAMEVMFKLKVYNGAHIEVKAVEDFPFLNSSYVPVLRQQGHPELPVDGNGIQNSTKDTSKLKFRNPKYLSILNHLRFYLPEMYPKLHKILFLDDDVVVQKDLTDLWKIDMDGKVNGAVKTCFGLFHRYDNYLNFDHPLIKKKFNPKACAWAYGMNIFDLDAWRRENCTNEYHHWQDLQNGNRTLWKLGTLPPGLITFYSTTKALNKSWHVLGLGYNPNISEEDIRGAAVVHYNGDSKPWLPIAIPKYRPIWTKYVDYNLEFVRACSVSP